MRSDSRTRSRRPSRYLNGIDFWAFLSVELVLLMIFMVYDPFPHHRPPMVLASAKHAEAMPGAIREDAMVVTVGRDGNVFFGPLRVRAEVLPDQIAECVRKGAERRVYLQVDVRAKYRDAEVVIDQVRQAGINEIGILTERPFFRAE